MQVLTSAEAMQRLAVRWKRQGKRIGFVPTMGYLHEGHLSLVARARREAGAGGKVVMSIYVNPTQFGPAEDFSRYPRDLARDLNLCRAAGVDVVFAPADGQMYRRGAAGNDSTFVTEEALSRGMEGASRPGHFRGVATVVAKLFNLVQPDVAVFGAKDFQQVAVVRRMARDLCFPVRIAVAPTVRERDGLAMSSRNVHLKGELRAQAGVLWRAIRRARERVRGSAGPVSAARLKSDLERLIRREPAARLDYIALFDPRSWKPARRVRRGDHIALAVRIGKTRLIDNAGL